MSTTSHSPISKLPLELLSETISYLPSQVAGLRLVCRGFRDCAWPTFGARLERTAFDIRSFDSMRNLRNISENPDLAPHVTSLHFHTGFVSEEYPGEQYDDELETMEPEDYLYPMSDDDDEADLKAELETFRKTETYWFDHAWDWMPCIVHFKDFMVTYTINESKKLIVDFLATTLSKLNLQVAMYEENTVPAQFQPLHTTVVETAEANGVVRWRQLATRMQMAININGLDILLSALAASNARIKDLTIPVLVQYCDSIITFTSPDTVRKVLANVEVLRVQRSNYEAFIHHADAKLEVMLSSCAAKLRHLDCDLWTANELIKPPWMTLVSPETALFSYPPLSKLVLYCQSNLSDVNFAWNFEIKSFDQSFFTFLARTGDTLKEIDLHLCPFFRFRWTEIVRFLASSNEINLDIFKVSCIHSPDCYSTRYFYDDIKPPAKSILYRTAKKVMVRDARFQTWLKKRWEAATAEKENGEMKKVDDIKEVD